MAKASPNDRRYNKEHEWALDNGDGTATVGITDYAQEMLTDIVFVELPPLGKQVEKMAVLAVVESVKSVSDIYAPLGGVVIAVNGSLENRPELINEDAFGAGWIVKLRMDDPAELDGLMDAAAYESLIQEEKQ